MFSISLNLLRSNSLHLSFLSAHIVVFFCYIIENLKERALTAFFSGYRRRRRRSFQVPGDCYNSMVVSSLLGMLGLEMPLHPQQQQQQPQNPQSAQNPHQLHHHPQMVAYSLHETDHSQHQQSVKQGYPFASKTKQLSPLSDEDEPGFTPDDGAADAKRKISPWQRMKWTDSMVRLLIMAVYYIGDEAGSEGNDPAGKKKAGGLLQKKGKWKSVSRAMMEKGFYVSPQQCEDKFNDLNKRYKRVNDILGRGTACKVVENQSLLDTMDLSPKMKEEVRKLLNSKHLFFREMCAYHNSCGHGATAGASGANHSPEVATETSQIQHQQAQQQRCLHSSDTAQIAGNSGGMDPEALKLTKVGSDEEDDDDDDDSDDDEDEDDEEAMDGHSRGHNGHGQEDDEDNDEKSTRKRPRKGALAMSLSPLMQQLSCEAVNVIQDGSKSVWEKHWMKMRLMQLEEQQVSYQYQAFELEKQRLKWVKFSGKKEREMEKAKLENERRRLENERMVLLVRQKELELVDLQHQHQPQQHSSSKRGDPSSITG
ncbi:Sequence-specific DNA binding transcription factors isoform 1 [Theobroma cacao]|uniref:Sequence-specific DNA binding transcription factors isoform 1 n=2 Tax=Theobroma cacao TaxID=3641 RepID=A0A061F0P1_THECC|nr:Sequence-specific DNA binding transcription factors isoform 1 [Theobroma cacao]